MSTLKLMEKLEINIVNDMYEIKEALSEGKGSRSFKGINRETGQPVFMKYLMFPSSQYDISKFKSEIQITKDITRRERNLPGCICAQFLYEETISEGDIYCLVTEWCSAPTLETWLKENPRVSVDERLELIHRICSAVGRIPSGYHHRDLHPGNILVENISINWFTTIVDVGIKIIDWGEGIPESYYGFDDTPEYVIDLIHNGPKKIEGSYYSLPPEVFTPWKGRKTQWGKYDAWPIALLMFKILTNKDLIEHEDLGSYIESIHNEGLGNAIRHAAWELANIEIQGKRLLVDVFKKIAEPEVSNRKSLSYVSRVLWDIRIENFTPDEPSIRYEYLLNPFDYIPEGGWQYSEIFDYD